MHGELYDSINYPVLMLHPTLFTNIGESINTLKEEVREIFEVL